MAEQIVFIKKDKTPTVVCPNCRNCKNIPFQAVIGKHRFKAKCSCGTLFGVKLEFRGKFRKETDLEGFFVQEEFKDSRLGNIRIDSSSSNPQSVNCRVKNLTANGLGFTTDYRHNIEPGNLLRIVFTLDNSAQTMIMKDLVVRHVRDNYVGCEFVDDDKGDTAIGFYLL